VFHVIVLLGKHTNPNSTHASKFGEPAAVFQRADHNFNERLLLNHPTSPHPQRHLTQLPKMTKRTKKVGVTYVIPIDKYLSRERNEC
jgi:hypothetical protein